MANNRFYGNQFEQNDPIKRFWYYVDKKSDDECWEWKGTRLPFGYGNFWSKSSITAHRYSWKIHFGEIPKNVCVCHHCDNPSCVNPKHLFLNTQQGNIEDKMFKSRQAKGSKHGRSKLTEEMVILMRRMWNMNKYTKVELSKYFGVSYCLTKKITQGKLWKHV